jgi:hypothetical protein
MKFGPSLLALMLAVALTGAANADAVVVRQFAGGSGQNAVGIVEASQDTEILGPQALTTDENGDVYLLDQVNGRIVRFDPKNPSAEARILQFPEELRPSDLIVRRSSILVWDGAVHALRPAPAIDSGSTRGLEEDSTRATDDETVLSAFAQMGSVDPGSATDLIEENTRAVTSRTPQARSRQHVASRGAGSVMVDIASDGNSAARIEVRREGDAGAPLGRLTLKVRDRLGAVEFLEIDHSGRMYVFAESIPASSGAAGAFVARYSPAGALEGTYDLPLSNVPLSRRFVTVSGDGDVYFLRTASGGAEVLGVGFRPLANGKVIDVRGSAPAAGAAGSGRGPIAAVRPLTRDQVIKNAIAFEGVQWQVNPAAYGHDPDTVCTGFSGRVRRPGYLNGRLGQQVRGIPYCWGCHGSLDQIVSKIKIGVLAGNICTHNAPRPDVAGVDCSAFVSAAWGLANHFTTDAIPAIARTLPNPWDLQPGDALNKPGSHVVLFLGFTRDKMAQVMEASPGACNGRVCQNVYPLSSLLARGFQPVRFRALENDTSAVAQVASSDKTEPSGKRSHKR